MKMRFDGADRKPPLESDLGDGLAVAMKSQEEIALDRSQLGEPLVDLLTLSRVGSTWRGQLVDAISEPLGSERGTLVPIDPDPARDLPQPAADRLRRVVGGAVPPGAGQDVLEDVVGLGSGETAQPGTQRGHLGDQTAGELVGPVHGLRFGHVWGAIPKRPFERLQHS